MKTVLITGASSGFGKEMVQAFLARGDRVIATLRNADKRADEVFADLNKENGELLIQSLDVTETSEQDELKEMIQSRLNGELDILINNAGYGLYGAFEETSEDQLRYQMEVNFFGPALLIKKLLPFLRQRKGKIINLSSLMGRFSTPLASSYSASKYALEGLSEGLFYELRDQGVEICTIQPGAHKTKFARSVVWAKDENFATGEESPYHAQTRAFKEMMERMMAKGKSPGPENVVKTVMTVSDSQKIPRRILVGRDAKVTGLLQRILPEGIYHKVLTAFFGSVMKKERA